MVINNSFTFGGVDSSNYGIYIAGDAVFNSPERDVTMLTVPGRNGQLTIDNGRFENIEVTYPCFIEKASGQTDIASAIRAFRNDLGALTGYQRLEDTYHTDEYRQAVFKAGINVNPVIYQTGGEFEVTFDCKPQRWLTSGETAITLTPGVSKHVQNSDTNFIAHPLFVVSGGYGEINIYNTSYYLFKVTISNSLVLSDPPLYIDCETWEAFEVTVNGLRNHNADVSFTDNSPNQRGGLSSDAQVRADATITAASIYPRWWII